jgi:NAD(P)-dependent dehydrogenase (short-subunit alcohol dehydrogenase family)
VRGANVVVMGSSIVFGASGGMGAAFCAALGPACLGLSRASTPAFDLTDEPSIAAAAAFVAQNMPAPTMMIDATGFLHGQGFMPEKSLAALTSAHMELSFRLNAIGPALLAKHFLPLLPRGERAVFVTLSAKVGSIGDNAAGGWYSYRAAKAALNQLIHTAAIELRGDASRHGGDRAVSAVCEVRAEGQTAVGGRGGYAERYFAVGAG